MFYFIAFIIIYILHVLLKLQVGFCIALFLFGIVMIPLHKKRYRKAKENKKRFLEVSLYLDTILYAFVKEEKVDLAIRDAAATLPNGDMKELTRQALEYLNMTFDKTEVLEESLGLIEEVYPCKRIHDVHQFMTHVEYYGGEIEKPVSLLLADKNRWERRVKENIAERKKQMTDIILSVIASLLICGAIIYMPVMDIDISGELLVQLGAVVVVVINDLIIYQGQKHLAVDWIRLQLTEEEDYYVQKMTEFQNYDEEKEKKKSILFGCISCVFVGIFFLMGQKIMVIVMLLMTLFLFYQHRVGKHVLERKLTKEIKYAFPNWLLDLVLLLQSENVHVALQKSQEHVPGVLRKELSLLLERLEMEPESSEPYHKFLQEFSIPEIHSAMGILYSLSNGNSGNADRQIGELVEKNLELLDMTEKELLKEASSGMYLLFLLPVVVASFKLILDMAFMMIRFVQIPIV